MRIRNTIFNIPMRGILTKSTELKEEANKKLAKIIVLGMPGSYFIPYTNFAKSRSISILSVKDRQVEWNKVSEEKISRFQNIMTNLYSKGVCKQFTSEESLFLYKIHKQIENETTSNAIKAAKLIIQMIDEGSNPETDQALKKMEKGMEPTQDKLYSYLNSDEKKRLMDKLIKTTLQEIPEILKLTTYISSMDDLKTKE